MAKDYTVYKVIRCEDSPIAALESVEINMAYDDAKEMARVMGDGFTAQLNGHCNPLWKDRMNEKPTIHEQQLFDHMTSQYGYGGNLIYIVIPPDPNFPIDRAYRGATIADIIASMEHAGWHVIRVDHQGEASFRDQYRRAYRYQRIMKSAHPYYGALLDGVSLTALEASKRSYEMETA